MPCSAPSTAPRLADRARRSAASAARPHGRRHGPPPRSGRAPRPMARSRRHPPWSGRHGGSGRGHGRWRGCRPAAGGLGGALGCDMFAGRGAAAGRSSILAISSALRHGFITKSRAPACIAVTASRMPLWAVMTMMHAPDRRRAACPAPPAPPPRRSARRHSSGRAGSHRSAGPPAAKSLPPAPAPRPAVPRQVDRDRQRFGDARIVVDHQDGHRA